MSVCVSLSYRLQRIRKRNPFATNNRSDGTLTSSDERMRRPALALFCPVRPVLELDVVYVLLQYFNV